MIEPVIPESFRAKPYARKHYAGIAGWAAQHHPFYSRRVSVEAPEFQVITRLDVQEGNELLLNGHPVTARTSGSTGTPVLASWSKERAVIDRRDNQTYAKWLGGPLPNIRIVALSTQGASERNIDVNEPLAVQLDFIRRRHRDQGACSLVTYPSNLEQLCRHVIEQGIDLSFMRRIVCLSEVYEPWLDELAQQAFPNAARSVTYSAVELGLIAVRCPHRPENYHIMAHNLGVEFLDPEGQPCREGEPGQVVVTDYWNRRTTMIRYALGDLAAPTVCGCGKIDLPAMTNVLGKVRNALKDEQGRLVMFPGLSPLFRDSPEIRQFQIVQTEIGRFRVRYVPRADAPIEAFFDRVRSCFVETFGALTQVEFEALEEIPRTAGGKFHVSICLA